LQLRSLYESYGYRQYKMNKFEEYDLYVQNKDFLISDGIITFTDTNGKLLALKPDVTLSIVKNSRIGRDETEKVYYNENVYRVSKGTHSFKEIVQVGIECLGAVDSYAIFEVLRLACLSLRTISDTSVLDLSHFGIVSSVLSALDVNSEQKKKLVFAIGEKNVHELQRLLEEMDASPDVAGALLELCRIYGAPEKVLPVIHPICQRFSCEESYSQLKALTDQLACCGMGDILRIDFSVVSDTDYYNGLTFKGFVKGIPERILSGGQYDKLLQKMKKHSKAIGFALYLDLLEEMERDGEVYHADAVLLYGENDVMECVTAAVEQLRSDNASVTALKLVPDKLRYKSLYRLTESGVELLARNA